MIHTKKGGNMKKILNLLLCLILTVSCLGCTGNLSSKSDDSQFINENNSQSTVESNEEFESFLKNLFVDGVISDSITLHYTLKDPSAYGIEYLAPTFGSLDFEEIEMESEYLKDTLEDLHSFELASLSEEQLVVYEILEEYLQLQLSSEGLEYYGTLFGNVSGVHNNLPITLAEYQIYREKDIEDVIALLNLVPDYFDMCIEYERKRSEMGLFMADFAVDDVISQCEDFIADPQNNFLIEILQDRVNNFDGISAKQKAEYNHQIEDAVLNSVIPAYKTVIEELGSLKGTGKNELGLCYLPDGKRYYEYLVKYGTGSDKTVDEIIDLVESEIIKSLNQMYFVYSGNEEAYNAFYESNLDIGITDSVETVEHFKTAMESQFPKGPEVEYTVKTVHKSLEDSLSPAFYMIPPIDEANENVIYLNMGEQYVDNDTLFATLAHEGYPGHLYQTTYFNQINKYPIRSLLSFDGYVEGWATYVELKSYDMVNYAEYNNETAIMAKASTSLSLAASTIIDLGVNYLGWTIEDTAEFMESYGFNPEVAQDIVEYVIEEPGNYLKYYIGCLEFQELESYAKEELGDKYEAVEFHKAVLEAGPSQFKFVKKFVDSYIEKNK